MLGHNPDGPSKGPLLGARPSTVHVHSAVGHPSVHLAPSYMPCVRVTARKTRTVVLTARAAPETLTPPSVALMAVEDGSQRRRNIGCLCNNRSRSGGRGHAAEHRTDWRSLNWTVRVRSNAPPSAATASRTGAMRVVLRPPRVAVVRALTTHWGEGCCDMSWRHFYALPGSGATGRLAPARLEPCGNGLNGPMTASPPAHQNSSGSAEVGPGTAIRCLGPRQAHPSAAGLDAATIGDRHSPMGIA